MKEDKDEKCSPECYKSDCWFVFQGLVQEKQFGGINFRKTQLPFPEVI